MKMKLYLIHVSSCDLKDSERTLTVAVDNKLMARDYTMTKTGGGSTAHNQMISHILREDLDKSIAHSLADQQKEQSTNL